MCTNNGINDIEIVKSMKNILENYDRIRGKNKDVDNFVFWDAVVISASDEDQKEAYKIQIAQKEKYGELPLGFPIHLIADPPDQKIGCGGSAIYAMAMLAEMYGDNLAEQRILFIPAGGYSQRLPSHSALGKLFSPVPYGNPIYQMLDLIFAVYLPFLQRMAPGIFLSSSDAIISYFLEENDGWSFQHSGFTALAHPSPVTVGKNHGVYVLPKKDLKASISFMSDCIQVLQKPSERLMFEKGAVIEGHQCSDKHGSEIVYTDSVFFFDMNVVSKFVACFKKIHPLQVEISSYGDFLQPLGLAANQLYIQNNDSETARIRTMLFDVLHGIPLHILVLNQSTFHHFGTMAEYIADYCSPSLFSKHFSCLRFLGSSLLQKDFSLVKINGVIMHSFLHPQCTVPERTIVEYCSFSDPVEIADNCIISNCKITTSSNTALRIPSNLLIHTVSVKKGFVTIFFNINDNLKESRSQKDSENLLFLNKTLKKAKLFKHPLFEIDCHAPSLWNAKLFPVCSTMEESFRKSIDLANAILDGFEPHIGLYEMNNGNSYMSLKDILKCKNVTKMLDFREDLRQSIANASCQV